MPCPVLLLPGLCGPCRVAWSQDCLSLVYRRGTSRCVWGVGSGPRHSTATSSRAPLWPRFSLSLKWGWDDLPPLGGESLIEGHRGGPASGLWQNVTTGASVSPSVNGSGKPFRRDVGKRKGAVCPGSLRPVVGALLMGDTAPCPPPPPRTGSSMTSAAGMFPRPGSRRKPSGGLVYPPPQPPWQEVTGRAVPRGPQACEDSQWLGVPAGAWGVGSTEDGLGRSWVLPGPQWHVGWSVDGAVRQVSICTSSLFVTPSPYAGLR